MGGVDHDDVRARLDHDGGSLLRALAHPGRGPHAQGPSRSLHALGCSVFYVLDLISPRSSKLLFTTSTRSSRCLWRSACACSAASLPARLRDAARRHEIFTG